MTGIIILNYNNWEDTLNCIDSVRRWNTAPVKYIVVDNGSPRPGTVEALGLGLKERFGADYRRYAEGEPAAGPLPRAALLQSPTNSGYAEGNNKGLRLAFEDEDISHIMILNNDTLFFEDIIPGLQSQLEALPKAAIISPLLYKRDREGIDYNCARRANSYGHIVYRYLFYFADPFGLIKKWQRHTMLLQESPELMERDLIEIELPSGSCMLLRKSLFKQMGGFDGGTFLYYEEDILFEKTLRLGLTNYMMPRLGCIHLGAASTSKVWGVFTVRAGIRSARYFLTRYRGIGPWRRLLFDMVTALLIQEIRLRQFIMGALGKEHKKR